MKIAVTAAALALMFCLAPSIGAAPAPQSAKSQLPDQASDRAKENRAERLLAIVPPLPPPPVSVPAILASFTSGQTSESAEQTAAAAAVVAATTTVRARLAAATTVSVITMTAKRGPLLRTPMPPLGRRGDLESTRWIFHDRFGRRIGDGNLLCRWATATRRLCWGEGRLPRGKFVMLGSSQTRTLGEFAVVGGTGVYLFKQGLLTFRQLSTAKYAVRVLLA